MPATCTSNKIPAAIALLVTLAVILPLGQQSQARAADTDAVNQSASFVLSQSVSLRRDGRHNRLLMALRHLHDPQLAPLFAALAQADKPALRVHGILGHAETQSPPRLDLTHLAQVKDLATQAELISAAMDDDLLHDEDAKTVLGWQDIDMGVKLLVATRLIERGQFNDTALLKEALSSPRLARRGLAGLLLVQLGDPAGMQALQELLASNDSQRDVTCGMLLDTAIRHRFERTAGWAYALATETDVDPKLGLMALRNAMRFGEPRASALWKQQFDAAAGNIADRTRLALVAMEMSPWVAPGLFDALAADNDPLLQQIARTGRSIASGAADVPDQVMALIQLYHPIANSWALRYARDDADGMTSHLILLGLVLACEQGPDHGKARRLDDAMEAAEVLFEMDPAAAANLLRPILASAQTDPLLTKAILLGLLRIRTPGPEQLLEGVPAFASAEANHLALLLKAKHGVTLSDIETRDLALLVQGGGGLQDTLRIQAAWTWLKRNNQTRSAITRTINNM